MGFRERDDPLSDDSRAAEYVNPAGGDLGIDEPLVKTPIQVCGCGRTGRVITTDPLAQRDVAFAGLKQVEEGLHDPHWFLEIGRHDGDEVAARHGKARTNRRGGTEVAGVTQDLRLEGLVGQ